MIFRGPEPDIAIPEVALTPFLMAQAEKWGERPAFIEGPTGRVLTHAGWARDVRNAARAICQAFCVVGACLVHDIRRNGSKVDAELRQPRTAVIGHAIGAELPARLSHALHPALLRERGG